VLLAKEYWIRRNYPAMIVLHNHMQLREKSMWTISCYYQNCKLFWQWVFIFFAALEYMSEDSTELYRKKYPKW